jgi:hypothetical protein
VLYGPLSGDTPQHSLGYSEQAVTWLIHAGYQT